MELETSKKILEETTKELLEKMGFKATVYIAVIVNSDEPNQESNLSVEIQVDDSKYLIGKFGINLVAFQHLLRILVKRKCEDKINFIVDVNGYKEEQRQAIIRLAEESAQNALQAHKAVVLRSMNAYERRIVHTALSTYEGVKTESVGEDQERKVVIKPTSFLQ